MPARTRRFLASACFMMALFALPLHLAGVDLMLSSIATKAQYLFGALVVYVAVRSLRRLPLVELLVEVTIWSILISTLSTLPIAFMVRLPVPFVDRLALLADARLGLDAKAFVRFAEAHPRFNVLCGLAYVSLRPIDILTLYVPVLCKKPRWASEMFVALVLQLAGTVAIMAVAQGIGPWLVNGVEPTARQAEITQVMTTLKLGQPYRLDMSDIPGFVAFPSWHVMLAMLAAFTIGRIRVLRAPMIAWATLVALSTLTTGWHYAVDVLLGVVLGGLCFAASHQLHERWAARERAPELPSERSETVLA